MFYVFEDLRLKQMKTLKETIHETQKLTRKIEAQAQSLRTIERVLIASQKRTTIFQINLDRSTIEITRLKDFKDQHKKKKDETIEQVFTFKIDLIVKEKKIKDLQKRAQKHINDFDSKDFDAQSRNSISRARLNTKYRSIVQQRLRAFEDIFESQHYDREKRVKYSDVKRFNDNRDE